MRHQKNRTIFEKFSTKVVPNHGTCSFSLHYTTHTYWVSVMLCELLTPYKDGIESIGAVGAVFEKVLFQLRILFHGFVLSEAVAPALHSCGLDG